MSIKGSIDIAIDLFGGLVQDMNPADLPPGASPDNQDVIFSETGPRTREGLGANILSQPIVGSPTIQYMKSFRTLASVLRTLLIDTLGNLWKESVAGVLTAVGVVNTNSPSTLRPVSATQFGREWIAIGDGSTGTGVPLQYDDVNLDRVAQDGPGASPTVVDGAAGSISAGVHKVTVMFVTREGYITRYAPTGSWNAAGSKKGSVTVIPIGPANVVQRILAFTIAGGANFFYIPGTSMVIPDNASTTATVDFTDTALLAATNVDNRAELIGLGDCTSVLPYAERMMWIGERARIQNAVNLGFDGGFNGNLPFGWTLVSAGGSPGSTAVQPNTSYLVTGDGATAIRGKITQPMVTDYLGVMIIQPRVGYSVRAIVAGGPGLTQGTVHVNLVGTGVAPAGLSVTAAQLNAVGTGEFTAVLTPPIPIIPADLILQVYVDGTPALNQTFNIDNIEIFPTLQPVNIDIVRASFTQDPESFDGVTGIIQPSAGEGQQIRAHFTLRDNRYYIVKDHSMYVTQDDVVSEPANWQIDTISTTVGTPSPRGVGIGEDWAMVVARQGLYLYWGPEPVKICPEIQPLWDRINWASGPAQSLWIVVDTQERRVRIGVPLDSATQPNTVLYLDYRDLDTAQEIATSPPIHVSYTGRKIARDKARKWSRWNVASNICALIERFDGTRQVWFGGVGNGKVYAQLPANLTDDGVAIQGYYDTYAIPGIDQEQQLQLRGHRKLYPYMTLLVEGVGVLSLLAYPPGKGFTYFLPSRTLSSPTIRDTELITNLIGERLHFRIGTTGTGSWFRLGKFTPTCMPEPMSPIRGV